MGGEDDGDNDDLHACTKNTNYSFAFAKNKKSGHVEQKHELNQTFYSQISVYHLFLRTNKSYFVAHSGNRKCKNLKADDVSLIPLFSLLWEKKREREKSELTVLSLT